MKPMPLQIMFPLEKSFLSNSGSRLAEQPINLLRLCTKMVRVFFEPLMGKEGLGKWGAQRGVWS